MHRQSRGRRSGGRGMGMGMNQGPGSGSRGQVLLDRPPPSVMGTGTGTGGPSRNERLQLHDLDLELALLKRKRELIEQQQNMLMNDQSFGRSNQYSYDAPFGQSEFSEPRSGPARGFGSFYGEHATAPTAPHAPPAHTARFDRKRPAQQWPTTAPKRFNAPRGRNRSRGQRTPGMPQPGSSAPRPAQPDVAPPRSYQAPQQSDRPPASKNRNFKPAKVTKPSKNPVAPNNLQTYPVNERKDLVNQALDSNEYILRVDQPPSAKLTGRLELALGFYLKELRTQHESGPFAAVFSSPFKQRLLKKSIRERIRSVMLDKKAGQTKDIMAAVRAAYPMSSDAEMLQTALDTEPANPKLAISPVDAVDPEIYIRTNFNILLGRKLNEMFGKLQQLYKNDMDVGDSTAHMMDNMLVEMAMNSTQNTIKGEVPLNPDEPTEATGDKPSTETIENPKVDVPIEPIENPLQDEQPANTNEVPPADAVQVPPADAVEVPPADAVEDPPADAVEVPPADAVEVPPADAVQVPPADAVEVPPADAVEVPPTENIGNDNDTNDTSVHAATQFDERVPPGTKFQRDIKLFDQKYPQGGVIDKPAVFYNHLVDRLIKRRLPYVLPRYKEQLIQILRSDSGYKETKAYLLQQTKKKAEQLHGQAPPQPEGNQDINPRKQDAQPQRDTKGKKEQKPQKFYPYFVKILGRPSLPKRNKMQVFLDQFNPASIKKHRGIHNLLFVALNTLEDYERILDANRTIVGHATLEIRISAKGGTGDDNAASINVKTEAEDKADSTITSVQVEDATDKLLQVSQEKVDSVNTGDDRDVIEGSLDDQITDLLSSIRNEEEKTNGNGETVDLNPDTVQVQNGNATGEPATLEPPQDYTDDDVQVVECPNPEPEIIEIEDPQAETIEDAKEGAADGPEPPSTPRTPRTPRRASRLAHK